MAFIKIQAWISVYWKTSCNFQMRDDGVKRSELPKLDEAHFLINYERKLFFTIKSFHFFTREKRLHGAKNEVSQRAAAVAQRVLVGTFQFKELLWKERSLFATVAEQRKLLRSFQWSFFHCYSVQSSVLLSKWVSKEKYYHNTWFLPANDYWKKFIILHRYIFLLHQLCAFEMRKFNFSE